MRALLDPLNVELDPETQAVVDEVCTALVDGDAVDPWSEPDYRQLRFGRKWWIALRNATDHVCRQRIVTACDQIVRADAEVWIGQGGVLYPRPQITQYRGRVVYVTDSDTGEMREVLQWPSGFFAGGEPDYSRKEAA